MVDWGRTLKWICKWSTSIRSTKVNNFFQYPSVNGSYSVNHSNFQKIFLYFSESVKDAAGHLTPDTVARHSQMIGIGKEVAKVYDISVSGMSGRTIHKGGGVDRSKDFSDFIELLLPEKIFCAHPGRHYKSFPDVDVNVHAKAHPKTIRERLERIRKEESRKLKRRNQMLE